jgi:hypothetical protein
VAERGLEHHRFSERTTRRGKHRTEVTEATEGGIGTELRV